jgi:hypothetical protein
MSVQDLTRAITREDMLTQDPSVLRPFMARQLSEVGGDPVLRTRCGSTRRLSI